jgi:hypothetical protein
MFGSETVEVAIGLAVPFTFVSLFASAARETIEAWAKQRAKLVHEGLAQLFSADGDESSTTLRQFYETIVISPLYRGPYEGAKAELPSYITSSGFPSAILEVARSEPKAPPGTPQSDCVAKLGHTRVSAIVRLAFQHAGGDPDRTRAYLGQWFDGQMQRVSGWYKRQTHWILFWIGLGSAVFLNVDAVAVTKHLYRNDAMRELIVAHAQANPPAAPGESAAAAATAVPSAPDSREAGASTPGVNAETPGQNAVQPAPTDSAAGEQLEANIAAPGSANGAQPVAENRLQPAAAAGDLRPQQVAGELRDYGFPIGWSGEGNWPRPAPQCALRIQAGTACALNSIGIWSIVLIVIGWLITALGISLGAPFWFDVLNKVMVVRSTVKPFQKSGPEGSEDRPLGAAAVQAARSRENAARAAEGKDATAPEAP